MTPSYENMAYSHEKESIVCITHHQNVSGIYPLVMGVFATYNTLTMWNSQGVFIFIRAVLSSNSIQQTSLFIKDFTSPFLNILWITFYLSSFHPKQTISPSLVTWLLRPFWEAITNSFSFFSLWICQFLQNCSKNLLKRKQVTFSPRKMTFFYDDKFFKVSSEMKYFSSLATSFKLLLVDGFDKFSRILISCVPLDSINFI